MMTGEETLIGMPSGIGDLHWIMTTMESFREKNGIKRIKVMMNSAGTDKEDVHNYSFEYLKLIPFIDSVEIAQKFIVFEYALNGGSGTPLFKDRNDCDYIIEFNSKLENHTKLKDILPEYDIDYDYPIYEPSEAKEFAKAFKSDMGGKLVLLFASSLGSNAGWAKDLWVPADWVKLAQKIYKETKHKPVLVGAKWDADYAEKIRELDTKNIIYKSLVGRTSLAELFALLREASVLIAFQCGVGIMATQFRIPVAAFWPVKSDRNPDGKFNRDFMRTWLPPWADEVGYLPYGFGDKDATPDGIFSAIERYL